MTEPIDFRFDGMPPSRAAEAAARRRVRTLRAAYPCALAWEVAVDAPGPGAAAAGEYVTRVQVRTADGDTLRARAASRDLLSALRLSFNSVEAELDTARDGVPGRAARWISSVRDRLAQRHGVA